MTGNACYSKWCLKVEVSQYRGAQVSYWRSTRVRRHRREFSYRRDLAPGICTSLSQWLQTVPVWTVNSPRSSTATSQTASARAVTLLVRRGTRFDTRPGQQLHLCLSSFSAVALHVIYCDWNYILFDISFFSCSSVGIVTGYGLEGSGIETRWGARFSAPVPTGPGAHLASCTMGTGSFPGVETAGVWRWPSTPSCSEVKGRVALYLYSPYGPSWPVLGWTLPLTLPLFTFSVSWSLVV